MPATVTRPNVKLHVRSYTYQTEAFKDRNASHELLASPSALLAAGSWFSWIQPTRNVTALRIADLLVLRVEADIGESVAAGGGHPQRSHIGGQPEDANRVPPSC